MGSGWRKAKKALGLSCIDTPDLRNQAREARPAISERRVVEVNISDGAHRNASPAAPPSTPKSSSRRNLIRTSVRLSKVACAICLESMKPGNGQALFTAECSHTFHFSCIASNVRHGNLMCPVCRAKWKEVPWQAPSDLSSFAEFLHRAPGGAGSRSRSRHHRPTSSRSPIAGEVSQDEDEDQQRQEPHTVPIWDELAANGRGSRTLFDDDEPLSPSAAIVGEERENSSDEEQTVATDVLIAEIDGQFRDDEAGRPESSVQPGIDGMVRQEEGGAATMRDESSPSTAANCSEGIAMTCHPEVNAVPAAEVRDPFTVLVHLKSSAGGTKRQMEDERGEMSEQGTGLTRNCPGDITAAELFDPSRRAPLDLVTVLDISGSMAGTKLILLKRAMAFVIRNLSQADRLSVVVFSSSARRLFPLKRMVEDGKRHALRCVDSLVSTGGTNIADGLKKGAKMLEDRRMKNPVASIMLLSDGQDTYTIGNRGQFSGSLAAPFVNNNTANSNSADARRLLPGSMRHRRYGEVPVPVHTFGFGADHDAATMHSISEVSGGTFSFIQAEAAVQDAFAQCIGGLLSVVSQDTTLSISTAGSGVQINSIQAGSYETSVSDDRCQGSVKLGDLYAEEERDILVELTLPVQRSSALEVDSENLSTVLTVSCTFRDPVHTETHRTIPSYVQISRPQFVDPATQSVNLEVDRQKNRIFIAQRILEAGLSADNGDIAAAQQLLARAKDYLRSSVAFLAGDHLSAGLDSELTEIQLRVANRQTYERTGRAYILSAQSSHFRQRATTRGDTGDKSSSRDYQTTSMTSMISRSQTLPSGPHTAPLPSPSRMLLRRISGRVRDSHG